MKVTQVLCAAGPVDAVTNQALAWRAQFARWGWEGDDFTAKAAMDMRRHHIRPRSQLDRRATPIGRQLQVVAQLLTSRTPVAVAQSLAWQL